jgi:acyl carrier protein
MSSFASIRQEIAEYLQQNHGVALDAIAPEATLEDVGVDSLGVLGIVTLLENKHGVSLETAELIKLRTFGELLGVVQAKIAKIA